MVSTAMTETLEGNPARLSYMLAEASPHHIGEPVRSDNDLIKAVSGSLRSMIATLVEQNERLQVLVAELLIKNECLRAGIDRKD